MSITGFVRKNAFGNKRRSLLTILSIAFSLLLLTVFMNVWSQFYVDHGSVESARRLIARNKLSIIFFLPGQYREKIRSLASVENVVDITWFESQYKDDKPENFFAKFGTDPNEFFDVYPEYQIAADQLHDWQRDRAGCVVDAALAARLHWKIGDHIHLNGKLFPASLDLTIRGIFAAPRPVEAIYFNNVYLDEVYPVNKGLVGWFVVRADSPRNVHTVATAIDAEFQNRQRATKSGSEQAFQADYIAMLGNVKAFILWVCMAIVFAALLVSANTMAMTIRERTRETAVLRSLGFSRSRLFRLFMAEAITISGVGGILGALGGSAMVWAIAHSPQGSLLFAGLRGSGFIVAISVIGSALLGILSSFVPVYRVLRGPIAGGLRHVG